MLAPRTISIQRITDATESEWQEYWLGCKSATYFHSPEWAYLWSVYGQGRLVPMPKLLHFSDGARALVPLCHETKFGGLLNRYVTSPEGTYGGWLNVAPLSMRHALLLIDWLTRRQSSSLVWRLNPYDPHAFDAGVALAVPCKADETHALRLSRAPDELLAGFKSSYRSQIKKAAQSGRFSVEPASTLGDWRAYFEVYQDSLRRWGNTAEEGYTWRLFESMYRLRSPQLQLWLARCDGRVVSGNICAYSPAHAVYWHGATLAEQLDTGVSKFLMFEVIRNAHAAGHSWFDFNPSAGLAGVRFFKQGFNAEVLPAPVIYADTRLKRVARTCAATARRGSEFSLEPLRAAPSP